ncbi:MAG TPA: DUF2786 domain-containing protein [Acidimicrobiales bacterium]|jgi:hypothetical protein|nr:DUF2786 domain-containing protein [Acidimicrobiales bacterium]
MGRNNQQRRADNKRRQQRRQGGRPTAGQWRAAGGHHEIKLLVVSAAHAAVAGTPDELDEMLAALERTSEVVGRRAVGAAVGDLTSSVLASAWEGGWQPAEVARVLQRRCSGRHRELVATAIAAEADARVGRGDPPDAWAAQLEALGATRWWGAASDWLEPWSRRCSLSWSETLGEAIDTISVIMTLPVIEQLLPPPSRWGDPTVRWARRAPDDPVLGKVRALLAKAESTSFAAEAEALTAKAQELMARHAIDDALARAGGGERPQSPVARRIFIDDPYASAKSSLLLVVAEANGARCIWYDRFAMMAVVGFGADLDAVDILFTSLLVQGTRAMLAKGSVTDRRGHSRTRSFRQSFLVAFSSRIRERLQAAATAARQGAEQELGISLLPVLAGRASDIDAAVDEMFPHVVRRAGPAVTNQAGWIAGRTAAELATLGPEHRSLADVTAP